MLGKRRKRVVKRSETLLDLYETLERDSPQRFHKLVIERSKSRSELFGQAEYDDPVVKQVHEEAAKRFHEEEDKTPQLPPLLHIRVQYDNEVVQTRYEASKFSEILHKADDLMDKVTGDDDDSDFESMVEVEGGGGLFSGLGMGKDTRLPELRILAIRASNVNKITTGEMKNARVSVSCQYQKKTLEQKSRKKVPNYRNEIGFCHVFSFRGLPIEEYWNTEIKINLKIYSADGTHNAYAVLSPYGCELPEIEDDLKPNVTWEKDFWKGYIDEGSECIKEITLPLIVEGTEDSGLSHLKALTREISQTSLLSHQNRKGKSQVTQPDQIVEESTVQEPSTHSKRKGGSSKPFMKEFKSLFS